MSRDESIVRTRALIAAVWRDDAAPTAVEYGLMVGLVAVVIIGAVGTLGQTVLTNLFERAAAMP